VLELYKLIDTDNSQTISQREFLALFRKLQVDIPSDQIAALFKFIDINKDGAVEYNELLSSINEAKKEQRRLGDMQAIQRRIQTLRE